MVLELLVENVTQVTITPFVEYQLLPDGTPGWGIVSNNNWIKTENRLVALQEEIVVVRQTVENVDQGLDETLVDFQSQIDNEAIERSAADGALQAQIPTNPSLNARFSGRSVTASVPSIFNHNLGLLPSVTVIRQVGLSGGVDVTSAFDTLIAHNNANQVSVTVGVTGTYTIICQT